MTSESGFWWVLPSEGLRARGDLAWQGQQWTPVSLSNISGNHLGSCSHPPGQPGW